MPTHMLWHYGLHTCSGIVAYTHALALWPTHVYKHPPVVRLTLDADCVAAVDVC